MIFLVDTRRERSRTVNYCSGNIFDRARLLKRRKNEILSIFPRYRLSRDETQRRRRERRITATRSGPFFRKVPFSIRPGASCALHSRGVPVKRVRSRVPGSSAGGTRPIFIAGMRAGQILLFVPRAHIIQAGR